ncbi:DUF5694 domain-containing protein [Bacillus horti]|uniref:Pheromone shutdown protein TraB n=1 Tax=Caldalkalibacillus horti TaxID=77523 RepID=A0ABT9VY14_9BACI|nr:DUF5694 domain-containing protein [Bacillus horti]MDQ0165769.1 pheromone shutdown protein TraB [Bacillus horti]
MEKKPKVLILGTFHMSPSSDLYQTEVDNLQSRTRQQEIREVVDLLKQYKPTKIAVEIVPAEEESLNKKYRDYTTGSFELEMNEVHQLGFRMAAELNHEKVYAIDWMEKGAERRSVGEVYEWAKANQPELFSSLFNWLKQKANDENKESTILDLYCNCNELSEIKKHHQMYVNMARIREINNYVGMDWLIWWYQRNLILFSNIARLATSSDDRIMLIIGAGHVQILYQFLEESGLFELESTMKYLKKSV